MNHLQIEYEERQEGIVFDRELWLIHLRVNSVLSGCHGARPFISVDFPFKLFSNLPSPFRSRERESALRPWGGLIFGLENPLQSTNHFKRQVE